MLDFDSWAELAYAANWGDSKAVRLIASFHREHPDVEARYLDELASGIQLDEIEDFGDPIEF